MGQHKNEFYQVDELQEFKKSLNNNQLDMIDRVSIQKILMESIEVLQNGTVFIKYGQNDWFSGSKRKLYVDQSLQFMCWTKDIKTNKVLNTQKAVKSSQNEQIKPTFAMSNSNDENVVNSEDGQ